MKIRGRVSFAVGFGLDMVGRRVVFCWQEWMDIQSLGHWFSHLDIGYDDARQRLGCRKAGILTKEWVLPLVVEIVQEGWRITESRIRDGSIFGSDTKWVRTVEVEVRKGDEDRKDREDDTFSWPLTKLDPEALRQMSKVGLRRLRIWALTKLQSRRH